MTSVLNLPNYRARKVVSQEVTVTGQGLANPALDVALKVHTSATVDHTLTANRVVARSASVASATIPAMVGPVHIALPSTAGAETAALSVSGSAVLEEITSDSIATQTLQTTSLRVDGLLSGANATADVIAATQDSLVTLAVNVNGERLYQLGVAVGPSLMMTSMQTADGGTTLQLDDEVVIMATRTGQGGIALRGTVTFVMPTALLAIVTIAAGSGFAFNTYLSIAGNIAEEDIVPSGTPVVSCAMPQIGGPITAASSPSLILSALLPVWVSGAVGMSSVNLYSEYTSLLVADTSPAASLQWTNRVGSPVITYDGKLLSILQLMPAVGDPALGQLQALPNGPHGRVLQYFMNKVNARLAANVNSGTILYPVLMFSDQSVAGSPATRGIGLSDRYNLLTNLDSAVTGGVARLTPWNDSMVVLAQQLLSIENPIEGSPYMIQLGNDSASNTLSLPDAVLVIATANAATEVTGGFKTAQPGLDRPDIAGVTSADTYWNNRTPQNAVAAATATDGVINVATVLNWLTATSVSALYIHMAGLQTSTPTAPLPTTAYASILLTDQDISADVFAYPAAWIVWGSTAAINTAMLAYGTEDWRTQAWQAYVLSQGGVASLPPVSMTIGGFAATSTKWSFLTTVAYIGGARINYGNTSNTLVRIQITSNGTQPMVDIPLAYRPENINTITFTSSSPALYITSNGLQNQVTYVPSVAATEEYTITYEDTLPTAQYLPVG